MYLESCRTGVGKIWPTGWIQTAKGFFLARGGSLGPSQPSFGAEPRQWCVQTILLPQVRSGAGAVQSSDSLPGSPGNGGSFQLPLLVDLALLPGHPNLSALHPSPGQCAWSGRWDGVASGCRAESRSRMGRQSQDHGVVIVWSWDLGPYILLWQAEFLQVGACGEQTAALPQPWHHTVTVPRS